MQEPPPLATASRPTAPASRRRRPRSAGRHRWSQRCRTAAAHRSCAARRGADPARRDRSGTDAPRRRAAARSRAHCWVGSVNRRAVRSPHLVVGRVAPAGAQQERRLVARRAGEHRDLDPRRGRLERRHRQQRRVERRQRGAAACRATRSSPSSASWRATISSGGRLARDTEVATPSGTAAPGRRRPRAAAASAGSRARTDPSAAGQTSRSATIAAPADWPPSVTRSGSPPNAAISRRTHSSTATWSSRPQLPYAQPSEPSR